MKQIRHHNQFIVRITKAIELKQLKTNIGSLMLAIAHYANKDGLAFPSQYTLAGIIGCTRETISRLISKAVKLNLLSKKRNSQVLVVKGKKYRPRIIYKISVVTLSELLTKGFKSAKKCKSDHIEIAQNDHIVENSSSNVIKHSNQKYELKYHSLLEIIKQAHKQTVEHLNNLKRRSGLINWKVKKGLDKSTEQIRYEKQKSLKRNTIIKSKQPEVDELNKLRNHLVSMPDSKLMQFTDKKINRLIELKANINWHQDLLLDDKLSKWVKLTSN